MSGVGPQMALGLFAAHSAADLARAIVQADLRALSRAPGVGKRTAERLAVELRSRLQERFAGLLEGLPPDREAGDSPGGAAAAGAEPGPAGAGSAGVADLAEGRAEVEQTLEALGYEMLEIHRALRAVAASGALTEELAAGRPRPMPCWPPACAGCHGRRPEGGDSCCDQPEGRVDVCSFRARRRPCR